MKRVAVDSAQPSPEALSEAAAIIRGGGLVAFPTETVYGLGANALDDAAVRGIFAAKGRPSFNPIIAHVASVAQARTLVTAWPERAERLAAAFWPGPLTLVLPRARHVPLSLTAGRDTVAIRMPAHPVALALIRAADLPIAAPSANRFTEVSPTTADHVAQGLGDRIAMLLDGGPTDVGIESTVVDLSCDPPLLLRPGTLVRADLERVLGVALGDPAPVARADEARAAPGMIERHYAPNAQVRLVHTSELVQRIADAVAAGSHTGAIVISLPMVRDAYLVQMPSDAAGYARALYAALHAVDDAHCEVVCIELPPSGAEWDGVNDRLRRAAHPAE